MAISKESKEVLNQRITGLNEQITLLESISIKASEKLKSAQTEYDKVQTELMALRKMKKALKDDVDEKKA